MADDDNYCDRHDVDIDALTGYDHCPCCQMERDREAQLVERATRHAPRSYDDCADISAYRH